MKMFSLKKGSIARGFTLIEILLVVGFIALAGIGVYVVYNKVQTGNAANTESRNIDALRAGVKNIYGASVNYNGLSNTVLLNSRVVPDNMRGGNNAAVGASDIINSFGGTVTVAPASFQTGTDNAFTITYTLVPVDVCSKLVSVAAPGFNKVEIGGTAVKDTSAATGNVLDITVTASQCATAAGSGATIVFTSI